ncbi:MAG: hypothetical protein AAF481_15150 [Acidobacteriota bacterium]
MIRFRPIPSPISLLAAVLVFVSICTPLQADDVYLTNGRVFEDVVAERRGGEVAIALSYGGEIVLPESKILRIEDGRASFQDYRDRERALLRHREASAADWLELALWARDQEYAPGVRRAAVRASRHDPDLPGLRPILSELGMVRAEDGDWVTPDERNRRRGLVSSNGEWISRQEAERRAREAQQRAADARRERLLHRLAEIEVQRQVLETARRAAPPPVTVVQTVPQQLGTAVWGPTFFYRPNPAPRAAAPRTHDPYAPPPPTASTPERNYGRSQRVIPGRLNPGVSSPPGSLGNSYP